MTGSALNARLLCAAELVRQDATFADIGTDHAYLPLFLLDSGRISFAYCSDINEGPLASARRNAEERGMSDKISFILTDGAAALSEKGISDYAICGMGGELIADIISKAPHLKAEGVNLILQPMSRQAVLRKFLAREGFEIINESYSFDAGKYYVCLLATFTGICREIDDVTAEIGSETSKFSGNEARRGYIETILRSRQRAFEGKRLGGVSDIPEEKIINALVETLEGLSKEGT